jgi:di/tricarboxylate transporter
MQESEQKLLILFCFTSEEPLSASSVMEESGREEPDHMFSNLGVRLEDRVGVFASRAGSRPSLIFVDSLQEKVQVSLASISGFSQQLPVVLAATIVALFIRSSVQLGG